MIKCIYFGRLEVSIQLANRSIFKLYDIQNAKLIDPMESGLQETSIVKTSQILTISKMRLEKKLGQLDKEKMEAVNHAIKLSLGLDYYSIFLINIFLHFQYVN